MTREQEFSEEEDDGPALQGAKRKFSEFECPSCSAHNPYDDFGNNDEVLCGYCGLSLKAIVNAEGELKLRET
jgi:transcription elongation factor Elf1